jgi:hypothetical protein
MRRFSLELIAAAAVVAFIPIAYAADLPTKAPALPAAIASSGGPYFWVNGAYESIPLPSYGQGSQAAASFIPLVSLGPVHNYAPRVTGSSFDAGAGYVFPHGAFWGDRFRVELNAKIIQASEKQSGRDLETATVRPNLLGQAVTTSGPGFLVLSNLSTDYQAWQAGLLAAADFRFGAVLLTPSIKVFGGRSTIQQFYSEVGADLAGNPSPVESYSVYSNLRSTDVGAKVGLASSVDLASGFGVGLKGNVGFADRHVALSAADAPGFVLSLFFPAASVNTDTSTVPLLANAEASIYWKSPTNMATLRVFGGLNYDSRVPGLSTPVILATDQTPGVPAGIKFASETSYYVGGGVTVNFSGP